MLARSKCEKTGRNTTKDGDNLAKCEKKVLLSILNQRVFGVTKIPSYTNDNPLLPVTSGFYVFVFIAKVGVKPQPK